MAFPTTGMHHEDVRGRLKKYETVKGNPKLRDSLINQARLHEGEGSAKELQDEFINGSKGLSGSSNKQTGIGEGKRLGDGTWLYKDGEWIKKE